MCNLKFNWKKATTGYAVFMAKKYGPEEMDRIRKYAYEKGNNYSRQELEEISAHYSAATANLSYGEPSLSPQVDSERISA
jgi:hypothetical protein